MGNLNLHFFTPFAEKQSEYDLAGRREATDGGEQSLTFARERGRKLPRRPRIGHGALVESVCSVANLGSWISGSQTRDLGHPNLSYSIAGELGHPPDDGGSHCKGMSVAEMERKLGPNLSYDPA
jgi:hypothetical protein